MKSQTDVFINRELSWIEFNKRVLLTGMEKEYKILDKVKFCSIFSNNLDEFFMVRVASLKAQVEAGITKKSIDGLTPKEQLTKINKEVKKLTTKSGTPGKDFCMVKKCAKRWEFLSLCILIYYVSWQFCTSKEIY